MNAHAITPIALAVIFAVACGSPASAAVDVIPIAQSGDPSPDGDGTFGSHLDFGPPCVNDSSMVLFSADLSGNTGGTASDELLVRGKPDGTRVIMAREGSLILGGTGRYDNLRTPNRRYVLNNEGRAAFVCELTETPGGAADNQAIFSTDGPGTETQHVRIGDLAPGTTGTFTGLVGPTINNEMPVIVAFYAWAAGHGAAHPGTIYTNRAGTSTLIAKVTDAAPGGGGTLWQFDEGQPPSIEPDGNSVAFRVQLTGTPWGSEDDAAVYKGRGSGLIEVARGRDAVPGAGVTLDEPYYPTQNVMGNVAFASTLRPTSAGDVIEIAGGDLDPDVVLISNRVHPDGVSKFDHLYRPALSAGNIAAFRATLKETPGGGLDDEGIYRGDGTILIEVAREGQPVPEGGGEFASFGQIVAINVNAQVLFLATLRNTPFGTGDNEGLYLWDEEDGITKLVRRRDTIPSSGGVVSDILALSDGDFGGFRSLNDAGEAVAILDMDGFFAKDGVYLFRTGVISGVEAQGSPTQPRLIAAPNPWQGGPLAIRCAAPGEIRTAERLPALIEIFNVSGRLVRRLRPAAESVAWDGVDEGGRAVAPGLYFIRMGSGQEETTARVVRTAR
jgi:hypothetical protein